MMDTTPLSPLPPLDIDLFLHELSALAEPDIAEEVVEASGYIKIRCNKCDKDFNTKKEAQNHEERIHIKQLNYHCPVCNRGFTSVATRNLHKRRIHDPPNFRCNCGQVFVLKGDLTQHIKRRGCKIEDVSTLHDNDNSSGKRRKVERPL